MKTVIFLALMSIALSGMVACSGDDDDKKNVYTVTFDAAGGTPAPIAQNVEEGGTATQPANPAKAGYVFLYWTLKDAAAAYSFNTPVTADITLTAKWLEDNGTIEYWNVSWNLNGGAWPEGVIPSAKVVRGESLAEPNAPVKEGSTFDGWYKEAALTNRITFPCTVTADMTLYAKWTGESGGEEPDYGAKADYFGTFRNAPTGDNVWEQFTIGPDRIMFLNGNGRYCTIENLTWTIIAEPPTPGQYPTDYRISGTVTNNNGGIVFPKDEGTGETEVGDAVTLYFYLTPKYDLWLGDFASAEHEMKYGAYSKRTDIKYVQVTWELNGGSWPENDNHLTQAVKDGSMAVPYNPTKAGNNFAGWYTKASGNPLFPYDMSGETDNITFNARWTDASPSATLKVMVSPGGGFYTFITAQRTSLGSPRTYAIPTVAGTHTVKVSPGSYTVSATYWACQTVNCMSTGQSGGFTISSGDTRNISVVNNSVTWQ